MKSHKPEGEKISLPHNTKVIGHIEHLPLIMGTIHVDCSAVVIGECSCKQMSAGCLFGNDHYKRGPFE